MQPEPGGARRPSLLLSVSRALEMTTQLCTRLSEQPSSLGAPALLLLSLSRFAPAFSFSPALSLPPFRSRAPFLLSPAPAPRDPCAWAIKLLIAHGKPRSRMHAGAASRCCRAEKVANSRAKLQATLDFLLENDVPRQLRTNIIQWARFQEEHHNSNQVRASQQQSITTAIG